MLPDGTSRCAVDVIKASNSVATHLVSLPELPHDLFAAVVNVSAARDRGILLCRYERGHLPRPDSDWPRSAVAWVRGVVPELPRDRAATLVGLQDAKAIARLKGVLWCAVTLRNAYEGRGPALKQTIQESLK